MRRLLAAAFAASLLFAPGAARANAAFDALVESFAPLLYWNLAANANATVGGSGNNGTCTVTCNYGVSMAMNLVGFQPNATTDRITLTTGLAQAPTVPNWTQFVLFKTSNSAQQVLWSNNNSFEYGTAAAISDPSRCAGTLGEFLLTGSDGSVNYACTSGSVTDGNLHILAATCSWSGSTVSCTLYLDGTLQNTTSNSHFTGAVGTAYAFGNDDFGDSVGMQGPMAAITVLPSLLSTADQAIILACAKGTGACGSVTKPRVQIVN